MAASAAPAEAKRARTGRRPGRVWDFFAARRSENSTVQAQCVFCGRTCAGVAARMLRHVVSKCPSATPEAIEALSKETATTTKKRRVVSGDAKRPAPTAERNGAAAYEHADNGDGDAGDDVALAEEPSRPPAPPLLLAEETSHPQAPPLLLAEETAVERPLSELQAAIAHQKLVLACVLNDVPLRFVEDDALADALLALRPDFPRLTLEAAQTVVLDELCRAAAHGADEALPHLEHFAVVHQRQGGDSGSNLWIGLDGHRDPLLLAETSSKSSSKKPSDGRSSAQIDAELQMVEAATVLGAPLARLPATATLSFCTEDTQLHQRLREWQHEDHAEPSPTPHDLSEAQSPQENAQPDPRLKSALLGTCLLRQTMLLQKRLLELAPSIVSVLQEVTTAVCAILNHPRAAANLRIALVDLVDAPDGDVARWSLPARMVRRLVSLEDKVRKFWAREQLIEGEDASDAPPAKGNSLQVLKQPSFWEDLHQVDALLAPFSWAFALSESTAGDVTSAQYVLLWLWLLALVHTPVSSSSVNLSADQRAALTAYTVASIRAHVDDHQFASILLDPRVHGAGLSATGKRKVKGLVVQTAARVFPSAGYHVGGSAARAALLANLGHYAEKTAQFADEIAWEMSAGKPAEVFWKDYTEDARELAKVARATLRFVPQVQSAAAVSAWTNNDVTAPGSQQQEEEANTRVAFRIRQIKQLYQKSAGGARDGSTAEASVTRHASILLPIHKNAYALRKIGGAKFQGGRAELEVTEKVAASHLLLAVTQQLARMQSVTGASVESTSSSAQDSASEASDGATSPLKKSEIAVDESWFAFRGEGERREIEAAIKNFTSPSASLV